jgi:hypothetical protein
MIVTFGSERIEVSKAAAADFTEHHTRQFDTMTYADRSLRFTDPAWRCGYLGKGEEKAAFCVCDHRRRIFVLELIDELTYLNGRFVGGAYFLQRRVRGLTGVDFDGGSLIGLRFTGLVKVREFVDGYEWSRFQWRADRRGWLDVALTAWLRLFLSGRFEHYRQRYGDVHDRNVLFEIRPWRERGVPVPARDPAGRIRLVRVVLQPVDVR